MNPPHARPHARPFDRRIPRPPARPRPLRATLLALLLLPPLLAVADDPPPADGQWRGHAGAAVRASAGNTRSSSVLVNVDMNRLTELNKVTFGGNLQYARSDDENGDAETTANKLSAFGQYDHNLDVRLFAFGRLALDRDEVLDLDLRSTASSGLGWKWSDTPELRASVSAGLGYTAEHYGAAQTIDGETDSRFSRATLVMAEESEHRLSETVDWKQRLELNAGVSGNKALLARFRTDLGVALNSTMSLNVGLLVDYNGKAPDGQKATDSTFYTGLNVKLGAD